MEGELKYTVLLHNQGREETVVLFETREGEVNIYWSLARFIENWFDSPVTNATKFREPAYKDLNVLDYVLAGTLLKVKGNGFFESAWHRQHGGILLKALDTASKNRYLTPDFVSTVESLQHQCRLRVKHKE